MYKISDRYFKDCGTSSRPKSADRNTEMAQSTQLVSIIIYIFTRERLRRLFLGTSHFVANLIKSVHSG